MALRLMAELGLDGSGFDRGLRRAQSSATQTLKQFALTAFGIYGVQQAIAKTVQTAGELTDEAERLSATVEQVQLLRQAAKMGGADFSQLASAMEKVNIARGKIFRGDSAGEELLKSFNKLGVSLQDLQTKTAAGLLMGPIAKATQKQNVADISLDLRDIIGKSFGELIPVLSQDFEALENKMRKLGTIMDTETAVKLDALGDHFSLLSQILVTQMAPAILSFVELMISVIGKIKESGAFWGTVFEEVKNNPPADSIKGDKVNVWKALWGTFFDNPAPANAAKEVEKEWGQLISKLREKLAADSERLKNPKPLFGGETPEIPEDDKKKKKKAFGDTSDPLVKVGNFLGSTGNTINTVSEQQLQVAKDQLSTQKTMAIAIQRLVETMMRAGGSSMGVPI